MAPLPRDVLLAPAQMTLKYLQALCLDLDCFEHQTIFRSLNDNCKELLSICRGLKTNKQCLLDLSTNSVMGEHVEWVSAQIDDDGIAKLATITWNFPPPSPDFLSQELFDFLHCPENELDELCPALHASYSCLVECSSAEQQFQQEVAYLLDFLKNRLKHVWNVMWKSMPMDIPASFPQISLFNWRSHIQKIFACLVLVEDTCILKSEYIHQEANSADMSNQLLGLIPLNRLLLRLYTFIFLTSQQPSASQALKRLPMECGMPARLREYGIFQPLILLRDQLPEYSRLLDQGFAIFVLFMRSAPDFRDTWLEGLGDLARCCMAVEKSDTEQRRNWAQVARSWYLHVSGRNFGRIQHRLALLSQPDKLIQLFHYTKSLVNVHPFPDAEDSVVRFLFDPLLKSEPHDPVTAFVAIHGYLFKSSFRHFWATIEQYLSQLKGHIDRVGEEFEIHGTYMALCNFAAIFEYRSTGALLPTFESALLQQDKREQEGEYSEMIYCGSFFAFETFSIILDQIGNEDVYPAVHVYLAFVWSLARNDTTEHIDGLVPWQKVATFLNEMASSDVDFDVVQCDEFPTMGDTRCLPEDILIRGYSWSQDYFPADFKDVMLGGSIQVLFRKHRCLWLGRRLSKYFQYSSQTFSLTPLAEEHGKAVCPPWSFCH